MLFYSRVAERHRKQVNTRFIREGNGVRDRAVNCKFNNIFEWFFNLTKQNSAAETAARKAGSDDEEENADEEREATEATLKQKAKVKKSTTKKRKRKGDFPTRYTFSIDGNHTCYKLT